MSLTTHPHPDLLRTPKWLYITAGLAWAFAFLVFWARKLVLPWVHSDGSVAADDWLGFAGSALGAVLGGLVAVSILILTLRHERRLELLRQRASVAGRRIKYAEMLNKSLQNMYTKFETNTGEISAALIEASNLSDLIKDTWLTETTSLDLIHRIEAPGIHERRNGLLEAKIDQVATEVLLALTMLVTVIGEQAIKRPHQEMGNEDIYKLLLLGQKLAIQIVASSNKPELDESDFSSLSVAAESLKGFAATHLETH